jgi:hypothetical protein
VRTWLHSTGAKLTVGVGIWVQGARGEGHTSSVWIKRCVECRLNYLCGQWHEGSEVPNSCPGFCVVMTRLSRLGDAPDFARRRIGKAAWEGALGVGSGVELTSAASWLAAMRRSGVLPRLPLFRSRSASCSGEVLLAKGGCDNRAVAKCFRRICPGWKPRLHRHFTGADGNPCIQRLSPSR